MLELPPFGALPNEHHLRWHDRTFYAFVHFGPNTFTGVEWGEGQERPEVFDPTDLDARQWTRAFKAAGMTGVVITAKHHDGFCLWPSDVTDHDVASSAWMGGQGDVLESLSEACRAEGLWFGVYLSPWDRHEATYGSGKPYDDHFVAQLTEVLTRYGRIDEVWFDGACGEGPNGKRQVYDWPRYIATVREHQPHALMFSDAGPDVRWCGNERAIGGETNWATLNREEIELGTSKIDELNRGHVGGSHWVPAECNTSIRPGWFWKAGLDDGVKSLATLVDTWYASVGRGGNFLLNVPPDDRGQLVQVDVDRLALLGRAIAQVHRTDVLAAAAARGGVTHTASNVRGGDAARGRFDPSGLLSKDRATYWAVDDAHEAEGDALAWVEFRLPEAVAFDEVWLEEPIQLGQRVERFRVQIAAAGEGGADPWRTVATGTTIGARRILRFDEVSTRRVRVSVDAALAAPALSRLSLYLSPAEVKIDPPSTASISPILASLTSRPGAAIRYTLDGTEVTAASPLYEGDVTVAASSTLRARAFEGGVGATRESSVEYRIVTADDWKPSIEFIVSPTPGLLADLFEGGWQTLDAMAEREPVTTKEVAGFDIGTRTRNEMCAVAFRGYLQVPNDGLYTLHLTSDDGSRMYVHDELLVDNDGLHGMLEARGQMALRAGYHPIRVEWFNARGALGFEIRWSGPGVGRKAEIPAGALYR